MKAEKAEERHLADLDDGSAIAVRYPTSPATPTKGHRKPEVQADFLTALIDYRTLSPAKGSTNERVAGDD